MDSSSWFDYSIWPGPAVEPNPFKAYAEATKRIGLAYNNTFYELYEKFRNVQAEAYQANLAAMTKAFGGFKPIFAVRDELTYRATDPIAAKRYRNQGPRPATTFDRRGRRRY